MHRITFDVTTRRTAKGAPEKHHLIMEMDDELFIEDFHSYLDGSYFSFRSNGVLIHGDSWALATAASMAREDLARQEIMYIGQAFGKQGATNAIERTRRHQTLQRIYEQHAGEQWDIFVSPVIVDGIHRDTGDHINDHERGPDPDAFISGGRLFDENGQPLAPSIDLIEHSLIEFFKPPYNKQLMTWNPDHPTQAMSLARSHGYRLIIAHLGGWQGLARFHSDAQPELKRNHVTAHELVTSSQGTDGRVDFTDDPKSPFRAWFQAFQDLTVAYEQSGLVLKIFGENAPGVRRPADVLLPESERRIDIPDVKPEDLPEQVSFSFPTVDPTTGRIKIGEGPGNVPVYDYLFKRNEGLCNFAFAGPPQIGKTQLLIQLAIEILHSGVSLASYMPIHLIAMVIRRHWKEHRTSLERPRIG